MSNKTSTQKGLNIGNGVGLYSSLSGNSLAFKTLSGGTGVTITGTSENIIINSTGGGGTYSFTNGLTESGGTISLGGTLTSDTTIDTESGDALNLNNVYLSLDTDSTFMYAKGGGIDKILRSNAYGEGSWIDLPINNLYNGLTLTDESVGVLGGTLIQKTSIELNSNFLDIINDSPPFTVGTGFNDYIYRIEEQSDGKLVVIGDFTQYSGQTYNRIIRLNSDGSIDNNFEIGIGFVGSTRALDIQKDGYILVGGGFTSYSGISESYIIRLEPDGSHDSTFTSNDITGGVRDISILDNGQIFVSGDFSGGLRKLDSDGSLAPDFSIGSGVSGGIDATSVLVIKEQQNGDILIGGDFTSYSGNSVGHIARLKPDGSLDTTFNSGGVGFNRRVRSIEIQPDGYMVIGGEFSEYNGNIVGQIIRLKPDGSVDDAFDTTIGFSGGSGAYSGVTNILQQINGKFLVTGYFDEYKGVEANNIIKLNNDATIDPDFDSGTGFSGSTTFPVSTTFTAIIDRTGKFIVGGDFTSYNGTSAPYIVRLNSNGDIDNEISNSLVRFNGRVLEYGDKYWTDYTDRSLVDREYVDSCVSGVTYTFTNGLTESGGNVCLGGTLTTNATINADGNKFNVCSANTITFHSDGCGVSLNTVNEASLSVASSGVQGGSGVSIGLACSADTLNYVGIGCTFDNHSRFDNCPNAIPTVAWVTGQTGGGVLDAYSALASGGTVTWDASTGLNKTLSIGSSFTLSITNLQNGMSGDLRLNVTSGPITVTLPSGSLVNGIVTNIPVGVYHLTWIYTGTNTDFNIALYE